MSPKETAGRKGVGVLLPEDLVERAKNIVYWSPGVTLSGLIEEGLRSAVERRERANGGPFKNRPAELQRGRPVAPRDVHKKPRVADESDSRGLRRPTPKDRTRNTRKRG